MAEVYPSPAVDIRYLSKAWHLLFPHAGCYYSPCYPGKKLAILGLAPNQDRLATTLKLTPGQIREALGVSQDAFRGWRATLSPLQGRSGYTPCFTPAELLALAVVKSLINGAGVRVGALTRVAPALFDITNQTSWPLLQRSVLVFDLRVGEIALVPETQIPGTAWVDLRVACRPIVTMLEEWLRGEQTTDNQHVLRFPLSSIEIERRVAGGDA